MLQPCSSCRRHVKALPCPFCGGGNVSSRSHVLVSALLVGTVAACSPTRDAGPVQPTASDAQPAATTVAEAPTDAGVPLTPDAGEAMHEPATIYGAPPLDNGRGGPQKHPERGPVPAYGAPPPHKP